MAAITAIVGAVGLGLSAFSSHQQSQASSKANKLAMIAQQQQMQFQQASENIRQKAMDFDASRKKREQIRAMQIARATAVANTTSQGANDSGSSALGGAEGSIVGQGMTNLQGVSGQQDFGTQLFENNKGASQTSMAMASHIGKAQTEAATWAGLGSLGGALTKNSEQIGKIGAYFGIR
jgi:hypothetical protein